MYAPSPYEVAKRQTRALKVKTITTVAEAREVV
jgi:hypothetical protein